VTGRRFWGKSFRKRSACCVLRYTLSFLRSSPNSSSESHFHLVHRRDPENHPGQLHQAQPNPTRLDSNAMLPSSPQVDCDSASAAHPPSRPTGRPLRRWMRERRGLALPRPPAIEVSETGPPRPATPPTKPTAPAGGPPAVAEEPLLGRGARSALPLGRVE
jgi:hypothetical protein